VDGELVVAAPRSGGRRTRRTPSAREARADSKLARERIRVHRAGSGADLVKVQELRVASGLTAECLAAERDLQGRCKLLSNAREAQGLKPAPTRQIARLQ